MAGPITHILFAKSLLETTSISEEAFIVGTSFPDIRYLGSINREATHLPDISPERCLDVTHPFHSGLRFHNYIDVSRSSYWKQDGLLAAMPQTPYLSQAFKLLEDIILRNKMKSWSEMGSYFDTVLDEERAFALPSKDIQIWHKAIKQYITAEPGLDAAFDFISALSIERNAINAIRQLLEELKGRPELPTAIDAMYENLREDIRRVAQNFRIVNV